MLTLHHHPGNASLTPHMLLEELGVPYELKLVDRAQGVHKSADYLKLNPNGLIPVLVETRAAGQYGGDLVLYETAAICLHLLDTHPNAGLAPAVGTPERAQFYKWLVWLTNTLQAALIVYFYPERWADDVAAIVLVDRRFCEPRYRDRLPGWIRDDLVQASDPVPALEAFWRRCGQASGDSPSSGA